MCNFPKVISSMQTASSRIWTRIVVSIFFDDNYKYNDYANDINNDE